MSVTPEAFQPDRSESNFAAPQNMPYMSVTRETSQPETGCR